MKINKELAEHHMMEMTRHLGGFFACCGYTAKDAEDKGKEVIEFIGQIDIEEAPK